MFTSFVGHTFTFGKERVGLFCFWMSGPSTGVVECLWVTLRAGRLEQSGLEDPFSRWFFIHVSYAWAGKTEGQAQIGLSTEAPMCDLYS